MANIYNAGQLATIITQLADNDIADLGNTPNTFIFYYLNLIMTENARLAYLVTYSDALAISSDGFKTFFTGGQSIATTLFEPMTVLTSAEQPVTKRTSYEAPTGWFRESQDQGIHVRGLTAGNYTLKYLRYPKQITIAEDIVEFPTSGNSMLCKEVVALIKLSKNSYAGAQYMDGIAKASMGTAAQGAISARGTGSSGQAPGPADVLISRGG